MPNQYRIILGVVIVIILSLGGYQGYQRYLAPVEPTPTPSTEVSRVVTINAEGRVVPRKVVVQALEIPGLVETIAVDEGDLVVKGDRLLALDAESLKAQVRQAQAAVKGAQAQLDIISDRGTADQEEQAEAGVEQAEAALETARIRLEKAELTASLQGEVAAVEVEEGQVVDAGMPVIILADTSSWRIETLDLLEEDVVNIEVGQEVKVKLAAYPDRTLEGKIIKIARRASTYQGNVTYQVTVELTSTQELTLHWGMTAFVEIDPAEKGQVLPSPTVIPSTTVEPTPTPEIKNTAEAEEKSDQSAGDVELPSSYVVRPGEFVYCLGRRFDIKPEDILLANHLSSESPLYPGQVIQLPAEGRPFPLGRALRPHPAKYTVQPGDTVNVIACLYGDVSPESILRANELGFAEPLIPGQVLEIP